MQRRSFLTAGAALSLAALVDSEVFAKSKAAKSLSILVLGGTGFIGPAIIECALARGHRVSMFNRGKTRPDLFPSVERIVGDRDPNLNAGLKELEGRTFDAVIDNSGYKPRHVNASAQVLAGSGCGRYLFVSSISAYREPSPIAGDETTPLATLADPSTEDMGPEFQNYGGLKALCEQAARDAFGDRTIIVRPGYIVGPDDPSGRFTYWPVRFARGGEIAVPGQSSDNLQVIDVRDLAAWMVKIVEDERNGDFNAVGPNSPAKWGHFLNLCKKHAPKNTHVHWISSEIIEAHPSSDEPAQFPIWASGQGESAGFHTWKNQRARQAGLRFRPLSQTIDDTLAWYRTQESAEKGRTRLAGPSSAVEAALIAAQTTKDLEIKAKK